MSLVDMELDNSIVDSVGFSPTGDVKDKIEANILTKEVTESESVKEDSCLDKDLNDADMSSKMAACDSDTGDLLSPTLLVFDERIDERIKALDEQLNRMNQGIKSMPSSASTITPPAPVGEITPAVSDYRLKYGRRRRDASSLSSMSLENRNEPSEVAKSLLTRSSIFDQDTKRLENLQTKYEPVGGLYASQSMIGVPVHSSLHGSGDGIGVTGAASLDKPIQATMPYSNLSGWGQSIVPSGSSSWTQTMVPGAQLMNANYPTIVGQPAQPPFYAIPQNSWNPGVPNYCVRQTSVDYSSGSNRTHHGDNLTLDVSRQPLPPNSFTPPYSSSTPSSSSSCPQPFSGISSADPRRLSRPNYNTTGMVSPGILKRSDAPPPEPETWNASLKVELPTPLGLNKSKELVSPPVSILKKREEPLPPLLVREEVPGTPTSDNSHIPPSVGNKRKADAALLGLDRDAGQSNKIAKITTSVSHASKDN